MSSHNSRASDGSRPANNTSRRPGIRVGATTETAAGENISSYSSRASDGSRLANDTGRRREVPAGVGPIIKNCDRVEIIRMHGTRYSTLPQKKGAQRSSRPPDQAFFSSKSGGRRGARQGRGRGRRGTQGRGPGGSSNKGGGSSSEGGSSSASSTSVRSHGGGSRPHGRFWRRNRRGHIREECTTKESGFLAKCARCSGFAYEESACSSDAAVLVIELPVSEEDLAVKAQAFVPKEIGKCSDGRGRSRGWRARQAGRAIYR